jgi:hypothetical protein
MIPELICLPLYMLFCAIHVLLSWDSFFFIKQPAHEKIGVVDAQWIVHQAVPSLGNQGKSDNGRAPWEGVRHHLRMHSIYYLCIRIRSYYLTWICTTGKSALQKRMGNISNKVG